MPPATAFNPVQSRAFDTFFPQRFNAKLLYKPTYIRLPTTKWNELFLNSFFARKENVNFTCS